MISPSMSSCEHTLNTLRYADRVKELGASDPSRQTGERAGIEDIKIFLEGEKIFILNTIAELDDFSGELIEDEDERVLSPEDSDLAQLRSLNDGECSADWYQFQESVAHLQVNILSETICRKNINCFSCVSCWRRRWWRLTRTCWTTWSTGCSRTPPSSP